MGCGNSKETVQSSTARKLNRNIFISTADLEGLIQGEGDVVVLNASHSVTNSFDPVERHKEGHIPGSAVIRLADFRDQSSKLKNMVPFKEEFEKFMTDLNVDTTVAVVVYDNQNGTFANRVAFILQVYGHPNVRVLDGGYKKWTAEKRDVEEGETKQRYTCKSDSTEFSLDTNLVRTYDQVHTASAKKTEQHVDARPEAGYTAAHIPNAVSVPADSLLNEDNTSKSQEELKKIFADAGIDLKKPVVTYCNTAMKATPLYSALIYAGATRVSVYDGSWSEWASKQKKD